MSTGAWVAVSIGVLGLLVVGYFVMKSSSTTPHTSVPNSTPQSTVGQVSGAITSVSKFGDDILNAFQNN